MQANTIYPPIAFPGKARERLHPVRLDLFPDQFFLLLAIAAVGTTAAITALVYFIVML